MSRLRLARELAEETGTTVSKARRFINDVGADSARQTLRGLRGGSRSSLRPNWWQATAVGGTGAALAWRQQDVRQAEAIANESEQYATAIEAIMESDLSPEAKRDLVEDANEAREGDGGGDGDGDWWPPDVPGLPDDELLAAAVVIILAVVIYQVVMVSTTARAGARAADAVGNLAGGGRP